MLEIAEVLATGLRCICAYTEVREQTIFKTCVEFWLFYVQFLEKNLPKPPLMNLGYDPMMELFKKLEEPLSQSIVFFVLRTPKPEEVLIVTDEDGLPKREELKNTENLLLYEQVREILRTFACRHYETVQAIILSKLENQVSGTEWSYEHISSISYATGCLAEVKPLEEEKTLLVHILRALL